MKNSIPQKENNLDYLYIEDESYLDSAEFIEYRQLVNKEVRRSGIFGVTIGGLKRALKAKFIERWTMDALGGMDELGAMPTRYRLPELAPVKVYTRREMQLKWNLGPLVPRAERF
jgi:hypothetical protein